ASMDEMLNDAFRINAEIGAEDPRGAKSPEKVPELVRRVWQDREDGKIEPWVGVPCPQKRWVRQYQLLARIDAKAAPFASLLLDHLRDQHTLRCQHGATFALDVRAMQRAQTIPGWSWRRYEQGKRLLIRAGFIEMVTPFVNAVEGRVAAQ